MPYVVGLTGGIGCGKSKAAEFFAGLGAEVIDTDAISHELTGPGGGAMQAISEAFGASFVRPDGGLDRPRMRQLVFSDPPAKARLEAILHPLIRAEALRRIRASSAPYVILVVPLLLETRGYDEILSRVLVVDCDESQQIERVAARSGLPRHETERIMRTQLTRAQRLAAADDVLANDADLDTLRARVRKLHAGYLVAASTA